MVSQENWLDLAVDTAQGAGEILKKMFRTDLEKELKSRKNLVTEADKASEEYIVQQLRKSCPDSTILTEERPEMQGTSGMKWIIDPVDGTTNFAHGLPIFAISIGLEVEGELQVGVVYNPVSGEMFTTRRGGGAFLNGTRIHVSDTDDLEHGLLVTGIPYDVLSNEEDNLALFAAFCYEGQSVRRLGSAALDFCYVAMGALDGYWELSLYPWDMSAGVLMIQEAGGKVTNLEGKPVNIYEKKHVSSNGIIHDQMLEVIRETLQDD